ncbi:hypothetical protein O3M35_003355 [Rhynocoris fuscipes]|uniref:NADH dehydrogenase [ubiquinone] 1 beta subcomplex subunit 6 n=1 Tax=Rhynocoris fuscipes TaxID=488301 RepID=A0AAW1CPQ4_9HEMI
MSIQGRLYRERERLYGMTPEEKCWRMQWKKDQYLHPCEPLHVPELYRQHNHILRRIYRLPLDILFMGFKPILGERRALTLRTITGKLGLAIAGIYSIAYYFKYNSNTWVRKDPKGPNRSKGADYESRGFKDTSPI